MRQLAKFSIEVREEDFVLTLVDDAGDNADYATSPEQLDLIIDALDELLTEEDQFEVEDEVEAGPPD